ncbi:MAG: winged helix-turn-helix transcriptional regulator [Methanobacteriota archaeon]|nr:MAG: winged helix-turn-helix transcriptional regulator [Euryarchaeota archaeon]
MAQPPQMDFNDFLIFYELLQDPFKSANRIAQSLGLAPSTVRDRISSMKRRGFLGPDAEISDPVLGTRVTSEVSVAYDPSSLGLIRQHVIFTHIPSEDALKKLILFCDAHPYTHYRTVIFGEGFGLYTQFDVPPEICKQMEQLFYHLSQMLDLQVSILETGTRISSVPDFSEFSIFDGWKMPPLENLWAEFEPTGITAKSNAPPKKLTDFDLSLLRELTINAKVPVTFLAHEYGRPKPSVSRHLKTIREQFVERGLLVYDPSAFNLDNVLVISGEFLPDGELTPSILEEFVRANVLPFTSVLYHDFSRFLWITTAPSSYSAQISKFLWRRTSPKNLQISQLDRNSRFSYFFYNLNFKEGEGWKTDYNYIIEDPLNSIGLKVPHLKSL